MGMYTELVFNAELANLPDEVLETLNYMTGAQGEVEWRPPINHPLFETPRWSHMLTCSSYYFPPAESKTLFQRDDIANAHYLSVLSSFKNYDDEVIKFLDWIMPYVADSCRFVGYWRYEEFDHPTLIYKNDKGWESITPVDA